MKNIFLPATNITDNHFDTNGTYGDGEPVLVTIYNVPAEKADNFIIVDEYDDIKVYKYYSYEDAEEELNWIAKHFGGNWQVIELKKDGNSYIFKS